MTIISHVLMTVSHILALFHHITLEIDEERKQNEFLAFIRNCTYMNQVTSNGKTKTHKQNFMQSQRPQNYKYLLSVRFVNMSSMHASIPCCFQPVNRPSKKQFAPRYKTFLVADLKLKGKLASFLSCFLARDRHDSITLYHTKM